ncbi:MAG: hypothetical protein CM15mV99_150 [Caudoviricetes sp.]|nr:MAG: hypothetical protein CM15mV99_150 [Caudoviricetes sp.]
MADSWRQTQITVISAWRKGLGETGFCNLYRKFKNSAIYSLCSTGIYSYNGSFRYTCDNGEFDAKTTQNVLIIIELH